MVSWIHIDDLAAMYETALTNGSWRGIYNAVAPHPETLETIMRGLARRMHRPLLLPNVPGFVLRLMLGEAAQLVTGSVHVSAARCAAQGFHFRYKDLDAALNQLVSGNK
jgi:NAD dependent epimerase/dehydratase family enzyme